MTDSNRYTMDLISSTSIFLLLTSPNTLQDLGLHPACPTSHSLAPQIRIA